MDSYKPRVKLAGTDGNVFALMGRVTSALRKAGQNAEANEMNNRIQCEATDYDHALRIMMEYVRAS